jgi:hypothetical protein
MLTLSNLPLKPCNFYAPAVILLDEENYYNDKMKPHLRKSIYIALVLILGGSVCAFCH